MKHCQHKDNFGSALFGVLLTETPPEGGVFNLSLNLNLSLRLSLSSEAKLGGFRNLIIK
jgi:hypothetical protein